MALDFGSGGTFSVRMEGPFGSSGTAIKLTSFTAAAADWKGAISPYSQVVNAAVSRNSQVDLKLSPEQLEALRDREMAFTACNEGGVVTIYALGDKPETDITFQAAVTEVIAGDSGSAQIYGGTVTTTAIRSDYAESDPAAASYIFNKPSAEIAAAQASADAAQASADAANARAENAETAAKEYTDSKHKMFSATLIATNWSGDSAPYYQSVDVDGILETDTPHYGPVYDAAQDVRLAQKEAFAMVDDLDTSDGSVTFTCFEDKPAVNIPIQMEVNR